MAVVVETTLGDITVDLFVAERPKACLNFLKLCKLKYYNFNLFHNIEQGFIAQTGDPTGAGDGGQSVWGVVEGSHKSYFEAESMPKIKHTTPGLVSMVSVGKSMVGSQFFFTLGSDLVSLDGVHCVIGVVAEGIEVLRKLNEAIVDEKYRPYQDIRITHTVVLEDPFEDPRGFQIPSRSPSPNAERLKNGRIGADEDIDDTEGKTTQEIQEMLQEREAQARAIILEIVGDLPDADIAPPENVLFICKLNPVTTDDDLEIIFSRFGKVKGCEVIRDKITGDSLQYAFVEFEDKKSCENAFFKMDNVLIDDRRIHVDFSQSVAKVKWRGKGRGIVRTDGREGAKLDFDNLRHGTHTESNKRASSYKKHKVDAGDGGRRNIVKEEKSIRRRISRSRSTSCERIRSRQRSRSRSRSPAERGHNRQVPRYQRQTKDTNKREKYESKAMSPFSQNKKSRDHEWRRYDDSSRDVRKSYDHRQKERPSRSQHEHYRDDSRKQQSRRSHSRSPRRPYSYRDAERSSVRKTNDKYPPKSREKESSKFGSSHAQRDSRKNEANRSAAESARPHIAPQSSKHNSTSQRDQKEHSFIKKKNVSRKKKKNHSSSSSSGTSSESSSESSSSEEERRKRKRKALPKYTSRKKSKTTCSSSSSESTSD